MGDNESAYFAKSILPVLPGLLGFDWDSDIAATTPPRNYYLNTTYAINSPTGLVEGEWVKYIPKVQADPDDILVLDEKHSPNTIHSHVFIWKNTLDLYILNYIGLLEQKCQFDGNSLVVPYELPRQIRDQYDANKVATLNRKKLILLRPHCGVVKKERYSRDKKEDQHFFPRIGIIAYVNDFCRNVDTRSDATVQKFSLEHDGIQSSIEGETPLQFSIPDYYYHEYLTGVSLSIEIASIFLECNEKFINDSVWEKAFDVFCQKALPQIVSSKLFFTRNTVARLYFQQILLELTLKSFQWEELTKVWENEESWTNMLERALDPVSILERTPLCKNVDNEHIDQALAQIESLLSQIKIPINLPNYAEVPTHGLAVFCNNKHKNVSKYLKKLEYAQQKVQEAKKTSQYGNSKIDVAFRDVHRKVREAIHIRDDIERCKLEKRVTSITIHDEITADVMKSYSSFSEKQGGVIFLNRCPKEVPDEQDPSKIHKTGYKRKADDLISEFMNAIHDPIYPTPPVIERKHIKVWKRTMDEIIQIYVPGLNKKV